MTAKNNSGKKKKNNTLQSFVKLVILPFAISLVTFILYQTSNLYVSQASPSFAYFPIDIITKKTQTTTDDLSVWIDMGASMSGFISEKRSMCVPSSYKMMLYALPSIAKEVNPIAQVSYYRFDSLFSSLDTDADDAARAVLRSKQTVNWATLIDDTKYTAIPEAGGSSDSLPSVLNALDLSAPSIIFTDMEADGLTQPTQAYTAPLQRIFSEGYCISVVGMKSAYSGILYNYTNLGTNYAYGVSNKDAYKLVSSYDFHHQPRPFYAIIVGTLEQCQTLRDALLTTYADECQTKIIDKIDEITKADGRREDTSLFVESHSVDYWLNAPYELITAIDDEDASIIQVSGLSPAADSPLESVGVPEYVAMQADTQTASAAIHITPTAACYADTYAQDTYFIDSLEIQHMVPEPPEGTTPASDGMILEGRGNRYTRLHLATLNDTNHWFSCAVQKPTSSGVTLLLTINVAACDTGRYRVTIPVYCKHNAKMESTQDTTWQQSWTRPFSRLEEAIAAKNDSVADQTVNLVEQLDFFHRVEANQSSENVFDVAYLTLDLDIL